MNYWQKLGVSPEKLIMGVPTYGRTFQLLRASNNGLQAESVGPGSAGKYTKQAGFLAYYEVMVERAPVSQLGALNPNEAKNNDTGQRQAWGLKM